MYILLGLTPDAGLRHNDPVVDKYRENAYGHHRRPKVH
jgi:hypothetical protein